MDRMGVYCVEALYYHLCGDVKQRDECMEQVDLGVEDNMILMDLFDDYYTYCELLLECGKELAYWFDKRITKHHTYADEGAFIEA